MKKLRFRRPSRRHVVAGFVLAGFAALGGHQLASAEAPDPNADGIITGLQSYATDAVAKLGLPTTDTSDHLSYLANSVPLSKLAPLSASGLDLTSASNPLKQAIDGIASNDTSISGLTSALDGVNATFGSDSGGHVSLGCGAGGSSCTHVTITGGSGGPYVATIPISITRDVKVPLDLPTNVQDFTSPDDAAHDLTVHLSLTGTLVFGFDGTLTSGHKFYLDTSGSPVLDFAASIAAPSAATFSTDLGFTKVTLTPSISSANVGLAIALNSPHSVGDSEQGRLTEYDWQTSALQDLASVTRTGSVSASLAVDSDLTSTAPDATVNVTAAASDGFVPKFSVGGGAAVTSFQSAISGLSLSDFLNITPTKVLTGLGQLAASVQALQTAANVHLPFLQSGLTGPSGAGALKIVDDLITSLAQQTVICGTDNSSPGAPTGSIFGLPEGTTVYCQATTTDTTDADSITWHAVSTTANAVSHTSGSAANGTIGTAPTEYAVFTTQTADVPPVITANYTAGGANKGVSMPVPTAQDLFDMLVHVAGLGDVIDGVHPTVSYDPGTQALTFHLQKTIATGASVQAALDFADRLKSASGLVGLSPDSGASVTAQAKNVVLDITFGVILTRNLTDISTHATPPTELDRFFVQAPSGSPLSVDDASVNATVKLAGQVGFLGVTAQGASTSDCSGQPSAAFCLGKDDASKPILALDLAGTQSISVNGHAITGAIPIPELLSNISSHVSITPNFKLAGGLSVKASINGADIPGASGGVTFSWPISSLDALTHGTGLVVTPDTTFTDGLKQFWQMAKDDPTALLKVVLDALRNLAQQEATSSGASGSVWDTQLPLVDTTPRKLMQQFTRLQTAIDEISSGTGALIQCTVDNGHTPETAVTGDTVTCKAVVTTGDPTTVQWSVISNGVAMAQADVTNASDKNTVGGSPSDSVSFTLPAGVSGFANSSNTAGYHIHVDFSDDTDSHTGDLPALSAPPTLQAFADYLAAKLGLPSGVLTASIVQAHKPGHNGAGDGTFPTLKLGLGYDICTDESDQLSTACSDTALTIKTPQVAINASLGDVGGGLSPQLSTAGDVKLQFDAHAQFSVGFPLDGGVGVLPTPEVLGDSGGSIEVAAGATNLGASASLGPLSITLGSLATKAHDATSTPLQKFHVGGKVTLGETGAAATDAFTVGDFLSGLHVNFGNSGPGGDCGSVDSNYDDDSTAGGDPTLPTPESGFACAALTMDLSVSGSDTFLGDVGFSWDSFSSAPHIDYPTNLVDKIKSAAFNIDFLLKTLPQLLDQLSATLSNSNSSQKLPVIGDALDAGANVVKKLNDGFVKPVANGLDQAIGAVGSPDDITTKVDTFMFDQLGSTAQGASASGAHIGILLDGTDSGTDVTAADVGLTLTCKDTTHSGNAYDCSHSTNTGTGDGTVFSIVDASMDITVGQGIGGANGDVKDCATGTGSASCDGGTTIPFDIGLDGLPLRVTGKLVPSVGWKARLDFGLNQNGPYVVVNHTTNDVQVGAAINLGAPSGSTCAASQHVQAQVDGETDYAAYKTNVDSSSPTCVHGTLGFLDVHAYDSDGIGTHPTSTGVQLIAGVKLLKKGDSTTDVKLPLTQISSLGARFTIKAQADANLLIRAGVTGAGTGFPSIYGVLHAHWDWGFGAGATDPTATDTLGGSTTQTPDVSFTGLRMDAGEFLTSYLKPVLDQVKGLTSPLKPIIDVLQTPIPVVSQLAAMVGQPPVTLISLAEAASGSDLSFVKSLIQFLNVVNNFTFSADGLIDLDFGHVGGAQPGSFTLDKSLLNTPQPETSADKIVTNKHASDISAGIAGANNPDTVDGAHPRQATFGIPGLGIPVLKDPSQIFSLLMGSNITLVDYDFGKLAATAGFQYTFGPFMVGPVPVSIVIGGSVQVNANLWVGYDSTGLREVISGGSADKLLDGLYFNTYRDGHEVPVVQLVGTVYAGAEVDLGIIKAGIEAGLQLTVNFFFDDPTPDGKMSFQDIGNKIDNPICLFRVSGSLDAFIKAFVEIDLFFTSDRFDFTILKLHLLDFSAACSPPDPQPATVVGHDLQLNIGPHAAERHINTDKIDEKIVVRPLAPSTGKQFGVTIFGAYKEYGTTDTSSSNYITRIVGDGGTGDDDIELLPGAQTDGAVNSVNCVAAAPCILPFTTPADLQGGAGADAIISGDGADTLTGGAGSDRLAGSGGDDLLIGGGDGDQIDGGLGGDRLCSGTWDTSTSDCTPAANSTVESGGAGPDELWGSTAGDQLDGGPGLDPNATDTSDTQSPQRTYAVTKTAELDGNDTIIGFAGRDQVTGGPGNDTIYGDEKSGIGEDWTCAQAGTGPASDGNNNDTIDAGSGSDKVWGGSGDDTIKGGSGTQGVVATNDDDFLCGNGGNDTIEGDPADGSATGSDAVLGGPDNDTLTGGPGNDYVDGGTGNDSVSGGANDDDVVGGTGRDRVTGGDGKDIVVGESATLTEYSSTTGAVSISHSGTSTAMSDFVSDVDNTTSSDTPLNCLAAYAPAVTTAGNSDCVDGGSGADALFGGGGPDSVTGDDGDDWASGGSNNDTMSGGLGNDTMYGDADDDTMTGDSGADSMYGGTGSDTMHGGLDADYMEGNAGVDTMYGDEANDHMLGGSGSTGAADVADTMSGGAGQDTMIGDNGSISGDGSVVIYDSCTTGGGDTMTGDDGDDWMFGGPDGDTMNGNGGADYMEGNAGADTMHGDDNADHILGGSSSDTAVADGSAQDYTLACDAGDTLITGDAGNDVILGDNGLIAGDGTTTMATSGTGTYGNDTMSGGTGQDQLYGELGTDTLNGNDGEDYLLGDLGAITAKTSGPDTWPGGAPNYAVRLISPEDAGSGADIMHGDAADDHMYGGGDSDTMNGDAGDDYMEGNGGQDAMYGDAGQDDMLGGSSNTNRATDKQDAGETTMQGGADQDVMLGDNGTITRTVSGNGWAVDAITGGAARDVTLFYESRTDCSTGVCGGDTMQGNDGNDRVYGEGGDDVINGNNGDDYAEGNQSTDTIHGDAGDDDLIGGSSHVDSGSGDNRVGEPDSGDYLYGDDGNDVVTGDNAIVTKTTPTQANANPAGDEITQGLKSGTTVIRQRTFTLLDLGTSTDGTYGGDTIDGGSNVDVLFGQAGSDTITGDGAAAASDDDYIEGNQGVDTISGNAGQDDIIGGSSHIMSGTLAAQTATGEPDDVDTIHGNGGSDVVLGDNGRLLRIGAASAGTWTGKLEDSTKRAAMITRAIDLYDLGESPAAANSGGDTITGDDGTASSGSADVILGQGGDDAIDANAGNDYVEGNQGADSILGQDGTDDLIGGSSTAEPAAGVGQPDAGDDITGGSGDDVVLGDNGSIDLLGVRPASATAWSYSGYVDDALKNRGMTLRRVDPLDLGDSPVDGHSGADDILGDDATSGGGAADVLLGQTGNDRIRAGAGDDYVEGNAGRDWIEGNANDDDLIGGSSTRLDNSTTAPTGLKSGQPDDADVIYGGGGDDLTAADNAVVSRLAPDAVNALGGKSTSFLANLIGSDGHTIVTQRSLQLLDLENAGSSTTKTLNAPDSKRFGGDDVSGGQGVDVVFGQDGDDSISGGPNDDYIEGNGGNDTIRGDLLLSDTAPTDADAHGHRHGAVETPATTVSPTAWQLGLAADAAGADLEGAVAGDGTDAGQDDLIGGSSRASFRDGNDSIEGDGGADAVLGDNGDLVRTMNGTAHSQSYLLYAKRYSGTPAGAEIVRHKDAVIGDATTRFCTAVGIGFTATCEVAAASGADTLYGDTGDDTMWGQDGNDYLRGGDGNDDMYGEQGDDAMYGDNGEDAMLGDRGGVVDTFLAGPLNGSTSTSGFKTFTLTVPAPPKTTFTGFVAGTVDRRTDLQHDVDGTTFTGTGTNKTLMPVDGANFGGDDRMFGGDGRDSMHGGYGDDVMNGDSGGDTLFGDRGGDVLWGGKGCDPDTHSEDYISGCDDYSPTDVPAQGMNSRNSKVIVPDGAATASNPQTFTLSDGNVDYMFGGRGAPASDASAQSGASGADIMDWRPRGDVSNPGTSCASGLWPAQSANGAEVDPCSWFDDTNLDNDQSGANPGQGGSQDNQHHAGIDWMYGGWDRDVMQADVANNGPNQGDWQADWTGVYNLWTHCNSAYGGFNDIYQLSPTWQSFLQQWAYAVGAGQGSADVTSSGSSAFEELALVYTGDIKSNGSGSPYPGTPGHFDNPNACGL